MMTIPDAARDVFHTKFLDVQALQWWTDMMLIADILDEKGIKSIVEIGTAAGGLSLFLGLNCVQRGISFFSVDIYYNEITWNSPIGKFLLESPLVNIVVENCFTSQFLQQTIKNPAFHPMLFLCDGGNKPKEFKFFGPRLFPKDIIGVHDYHYEFHDHDIVEAGNMFSFSSWMPSRWDTSYWYWALCQ